MRRFQRSALTCWVVVFQGFLLMPEVGAQGTIRVGDSNWDCELDIADPIFTLTRLFLDGPEPSCRSALDANLDGGVDISDAVFTLVHLFLGGPIGQEFVSYPPPPPFTCTKIACGAHREIDVKGSVELQIALSPGGSVEDVAANLGESFTVAVQNSGVAVSGNPTAFFYDVCDRQALRVRQQIALEVLDEMPEVESTGVLDTKHRGSRPNIVFILSDDQGWNDIGYHGSEISTPNLDALAAEGIVLDRHYVYATCSPTRAALLTGRPASRFGILGPIAGTSTQALPFSVSTLPDSLRDLGYFTALSGKWHLGLSIEVGPGKYGFDSTYGYLHGQIDPYTHLYKFGDQSWHRDDVLFDETGHSTDLITDEAIRVIESSTEQPFFLYVAYSVPHAPLNEPAEWVDMYSDLPSESRARFAASISHMDDGIGRVVDALERMGQRESTLIIFSSDNGGVRRWSQSSRDTQYGGDYADVSHDVMADNTPLRDWKGSLFEGGVRVPAFVNWRGTLDPGTFSGPVSIVDWMPTLLALAGGAPYARDDLEGRDMWPCIAGDGEPSSRLVYWRTGSRLALHHGSWKLIQNTSGGTIGLFDVSADPVEEFDRQLALPDLLLDLQTELARERARDD